MELLVASPPRIVSSLGQLRLASSLRLSSSLRNHDPLLAVIGNQAVAPHPVSRRPGGTGQLRAFGREAVPKGIDVILLTPAKARPASD